MSIHCGSKSVACILAGLSLLLAVPAFPADRVFQEGSAGQGSLRYHGEIAVLHVYGTPEEMGSQYGKLLGKPIVDTVEVLPGRFLKPEDLKKIQALAPKLEPAIPADILAEMKAMAQGAGVDYQKLLVLNAMLGSRSGCTSIAAGGQATAGGEPFLGRNGDWSDRTVMKYPLVTVRHGKGKLAFADVSGAGILGAVAGINEKRLAVAWTLGPGGAYGQSDPLGTSVLLVFRKVLEQASTAAEAEKVIGQTKVDITATLTVIDAKGDSLVAELTPKRTLFRHPEQGILYATNTFLAPGWGQPHPTCNRLKWLDQNVKGRTGIDEAFMHKALAGTAQGSTLQSMIFFPARRAVAVSFVKAKDDVAAKGTFTLLTTEDLFGVK